MFSSVSQEAVLAGAHTVSLFAGDHDWRRSWVAVCFTASFPTLFSSWVSFTTMMSIFLGRGQGRR